MSDVVDLGERPRSSYCWRCGRGCWTLGSNSRWIPHAPDCPKVAKWSMKRQAHEAETLRHLGAPFPIEDSPWAGDEDARRRVLRRAGVPAPKPKGRDA